MPVDESKQSCRQCGKPAIEVYNGHPLCVFCYAHLEYAISLRQAREAAWQNYYQEMADYVSQYGSCRPKLEMPVPPSLSNAINVNGSNVRVINSGSIGGIANGDL